MPSIPMIYALILSTPPNPSTVVAVTLSAVSASLIFWKTTQLIVRVLSARRIAREFELIVSSERVWEVTETPSHETKAIRLNRVESALKVLSKIDLEAYLVDRVTRYLIDSSLAVLSSQLFDRKEEDSGPSETEFDDRV
jgi:hypothetical protein